MSKKVKKEVLTDQQEMEQIKQAAKEDYESRSQIYSKVLDNPTLQSLANHIVNLYDADAQSMRQEIINAGMFKTVLDILIEKNISTSDEIDEKLAFNIKAIEDAYTEQYEKFEEMMKEQEGEE